MRVEGHEERDLREGWQAAPCPPGAFAGPATPALDWLGARVPGTAAGALRDAGLLRSGSDSGLDGQDWWFRTRFDATPPADGEEVWLQVGGVATVYEVYLNEQPLLAGESMFAARSVEVGPLLREDNELAIRCCALGPLLAERRTPRARWRTRLVDGNLRFFRTMLLGRAPGFAPGPAAVGPWRGVRLVHRRAVAVEDAAFTPYVSAPAPDAPASLHARLRLRSLDGRAIEAAEVELSGPSGSHRAPLSLTRDGECLLAEGSLQLAHVAVWWPHTHGEPALHDVSVHLHTSAGEVLVDGPRVGFRALAPGASEGHEPLEDGLDLHVNGIRVFARGGVWTPADPVGLAPDRATVRALLLRVREAGMNMIRIPGTSAYESADFHDLCDELGLLVWQDMMFANLDYPIAEEGFRDAVAAEARAVLGGLRGRPSLAVVCGNSEVEQQVAMLGLDPALGRGELFGEMLPVLAAEQGLDAVYVPSAPCGGELPFRPDRGVANYYGVGGYRRPLEDARRAEVRFAAECLAFSNVPDEQGVAAVMPDDPGQVVVHHPRWKAGVPRDVGSGWDFEDVRDHYLELLFGVSPQELRRIDHERYLELSRAVTGEAMAEVFGEWRRAASPCGGGLVLWLKDLVPGAGWGLLDSSGRPKPAYHHVRRALAPVAVWTTDEGLSGVHVHVANDLPAALDARLRVALYRDGETRVAEGTESLQLGAHAYCERDAESLLGHFADISFAYRFGPPGHDTVLASLEQDSPDGDVRIIGQSFRFPCGRPLRRVSASELGLKAELRAGPGGSLSLLASSERLAYGVRLHADGIAASDDAFTLEPGVARTVQLTQEDGSGFEDGELPAVTLGAINLHGRVRASASVAPG